MSNFSNTSDCLVLKITELDVVYTDPSNNNVKSIDNTIYVFYDIYEDRYYLRGKRYDRPNTTCPSTPYSFCCDSKHDLFDFINFIIPKGTKVLIDLLTYQNMPTSSNDVTYDYLDSNYSPANEIVGLNPRKLKQDMFVNVLRMLRNIYNDY